MNYRDKLDSIIPIKKAMLNSVIINIIVVTLFSIVLIGLNYPSQISFTDLTLRDNGSITFITTQVKILHIERGDTLVFEFYKQRKLLKSLPFLVTYRGPATQLNRWNIRCHSLEASPSFDNAYFKFGYVKIRLQTSQNLFKVLFLNK